jgi:exosortase C (VPDSG-CTERM-specific)
MSELPASLGHSGTDAAGSTKPTMRMRLFYALALLLILAFALPLWRLVRFVLNSDLQSHLLLIPFIFLYLVRFKHARPVVVKMASTPAVIFAALLTGLLGCLALTTFFIAPHFGVSPNDALTLSTFSFLCFLFAGALATFGWSNLRAHRFAILFLFFLVPLPLVATDFLSRALQHASAEAADLTFRLTGMPVFREGLAFRLPGLTIFVAEECSGIRSTLVLFITSVLASHLFLRTTWKKALLVLLIFPLGVARNAFRITVISWLTVNVDRRIIDSPLHHRGGPLFFALSLVPLFALLWWLRKTDLKKDKTLVPSSDPSPLRSASTR